jgi:hypothetical protein
MAHAHGLDLHHDPSTKFSARRAGRFVEAVEDAAALARAVTFELQGRGRDDRSGRVGYHARVAAMASR